MTNCYYPMQYLPFLSFIVALLNPLNWAIHFTLGTAFLAINMARKYGVFLSFFHMRPWVAIGAIQNPLHWDEMHTVYPTGGSARP
jgi:hypothetical protein